MPSPHLRLRTLVPYATAVLAVTAALAVKLLLTPLMTAEAPFLLFHAAVLFSAWRGGVGPGLLATALGTLAADYFFILPVHRLLVVDDPSQAVRVFVFVAEGTFISLFSGLRQRASREAYRLSRELSAVLRSIGDAVAVADSDGRIVLLNPAAERLTGWPTVDAAGRTAAEVIRLIRETTREPVDCPVRTVIDTGRTTGLVNHTRLVARDGSEIPLDDIAAPMHDLTGRLVGVVLVFRDITDRRRAEAAREEAHRRCTAILESIGDAFYALDRDWRFTYVNARAEQFFGRPRSELLGRSIWEAFPDVPGSVIEAEYRRAVTAGADARFETHSPTTGRWVEVAAYPSADGLAVYFQDVTDRKRAEAGQARLQDELAAEQALLRTVLEQLPIGVVAADAASGQIILSNAPARLPWDGQWAEVELHGPAERVAGGPLERALARAIGGETVRGAEVRREEPDGRIAWYRVNAAPVRNAAGVLAWAVLVLDDVTAEKEAEDGLRQSHAELEVRVRTQGAELTRTAETLETEAAARREAERDRQQLVARLTTITEDERRQISRELHDETSQLLAALIVGLKTVRCRPDVGEPASHMLEALQQQADLVGRAVHRIAWELQPAALDEMGLEAALRSWVERCAGWADVPAEFYSTLGDGRLSPEVETQLYRLVTEALANAHKHARATRVSVLLESRQDILVVAVEDNGRGFDPERVGTHGSRRGLGLLGMQERAHLLGGSLHIESAPGRGTTVLARVPYTPRAAKEP